jgi:general nucleoside transport system permease protein
MGEFSVDIVAFVRLVILTMVPFILAAQGTMLAGRTGVFNVSQEGAMLTSASVGFLVTLKTGSLVAGIVAAMATGGLFGLALAYFTTTLKMNQFVIGLALFFLGVGLSTLLPKLVIGVTLMAPIIPTLQVIPIPVLSEIPILGPILFEQNILVYTSILLSIFLYYFLYKTNYGLVLRSVGENPRAADSLGINVYAVRYAAVIVGGMMIGLAGVYLPMVYTGTFTELMTSGRGWLSSALAFFGGWRPHTIFYGALFFAFIETLSFRAQVTDIGVPYQFLLMLPYIGTLVVMIFSFGKPTTPAYLGKNYDREKRSL